MVSKIEKEWEINIPAGDPEQRRRNERLEDMYQNLGAQNDRNENMMGFIIIALGIMGIMLVGLMITVVQGCAP